MDAKCVCYSLSSVTHGYVLHVYLCFDLNGNSVSMHYWWQRIASIGCSPKWRYADTERQRGEELLKKYCYFNFFAYKKYSHRFITLGLNHWWQMDYFDDVFYTYFVPWQCNLLGSQWDSQWDSHKLPGFHPKYLVISCSEDERSFYWFGKLAFWGGVSL